MEYQIWTWMNGSGESYAVQIHQGKVIGACGPLAPEEQALAAEDLLICDYDRDDGEWIEARQDQFRLAEA